MVIMGLLGQVGPNDSPLWYAVILSSGGFLLSWAAVRWMNSKNLFLRL
ncbi:MAG: hypothetical protein DVB22_000431 [Verrucomicrobia bacterium]|jgi:hypothetical protein|nr:MAG: hypothetical protein DVB22_000431 [Verrucomicrobiota bacterium]